jgi:tRNA (mo5U34)-methyltransferase
MTDHDRADLINQAMAKEWFYSYNLPDGQQTPTYHHGQLDAIHDTRWEMLENYLSGVFDGQYSHLTAVDLASHQGFFAVKTAQLGFAEVLGVEARQSHVNDSNLIRDVFAHSQLNFMQSDIHDIDPKQLGQFDLVLMLGLLYHLENPIGALRLCRKLCKGVCLIETQIVPGMTGVVDYGSYQFVRPLKGSFGIIDETGETHGPEASVTGICLVPSLEALKWILLKVGFNEVTVLEPPETAYEQLRYGKRVMVAAHV